MTVLSLIAAMDENRLIGSANALPWRLSGDLKRFKKITMGKPIIMGRKTHESIGRPLPGRRNIVVSRDLAYAAEGCECAASIDAALALAGDVPEAIIIGGAQIYREALPRVRRMYLTLIEAAFEGDTWFPQFSPGHWRELERDTHRQPDASGALIYHLVVLERIGGV